MQITVSEAGKGTIRTTMRVGDVEFDIGEVHKFPEDSLERSVAYAGVIDIAENARECALLRSCAARIPVAAIRRNQRYRNDCWGGCEMERLLRAAGEDVAGDGRRRHGEALSVAAWERLEADDATKVARERARIDRLYGLDAHLAHLSKSVAATYAPPPTRRWNFLKPDGKLDLQVLREPVVARRKWSWETHGDIAMLAEADLDLFMGVCAASVGNGIHLVGSSDPDLHDRWKASVERRAPAAWERHRAAMGGSLPTGSLQATPELLVIFDAAQSRMEALGADPVRPYEFLPRYQYQKWPLSHVLIGTGRTGDGATS